MNPILTLSIIGSLASLVSLLISKPSLKSKIIHFTYAITLTILAGGSILFIKNSEIKHSNETAVQQNTIDSLNVSLNTLEDISLNAERIINTYPYTTDAGDNRGFILTSFAFLEKNKEYFPETFQLSKELLKDGLFITTSAPDELKDKWDERKRMEDGASTMKALLKGLINKK